MMERFIVKNDETVLGKFNNELEARKFARETSKKDEVTVTLIDTFLGTESEYAEFPVWF